jgi:hypothetical protein
MGMWEASMNNTHRAIDLIPRDVMICDWHYERPDKSAVYFAMKGLRVVTCPWRNPKVAVAQVDDMVRFRKESAANMQNNFQGIVQTVWSDPVSFMDGFYGKTKDERAGENTPWNSFRAAFAKIKEVK